MGVVMDQPFADVDGRQFIAEVGEAPLEKPQCQRRFPGAWRRRQYTDTTGKRHCRAMKEVQVGAPVLEREGQALVEVPQKSVHVLDLSAEPIEVANTEARCCIAVAPFNLIAGRYFRVRPGEGHYQTTEGNLNKRGYRLVGTLYMKYGAARAQRNYAHFAIDAKRHTAEAF